MQLLLAIFVLGDEVMEKIDTRLAQRTLYDLPHDRGIVDDDSGNGHTAVLILHWREMPVCFSLHDRSRISVGMTWQDITSAWPLGWLQARLSKVIAIVADKLFRKHEERSWVLVATRM